MRKERIIKGWDQAAPSEMQRQRMRTALESRLEAETTGKVTQEPRKLDVHRIPAGRKKQSLAPLAAVLALILMGSLAYLWLTETREAPSPSMVAPTEETAIPAEEAAYKPVIDKYITAIRERWDASRCTQEEISILVRDVKSLDDLGYGLIDLNEDGQRELFITDGNVIYDMYALIQGEVHPLLTSWERNAYFLAGKNAIMNIGASSAAQTTYQVFSYVEGTLFENLWVLRFDGERDPENPWLFQEAPVTEAMADYILAQRPHCYIRHTPFSADVVESDTPEDETLLYLYAASIPKALENYSKDQPVTYCFYDADGDGKREMLLGAGKACYGILNISESTGEVQVSKPASGELTNWYLCKDGIRKYITSSDTDMTYEFARKEGAYYKTFLRISSQKDSDLWLRYDVPENMMEQIVKTEITIEEVQAVLDSYPLLHLDWQPIGDFPVALPPLPIEMFDKAFAPVASGAVENTWEQLDPLLAYAGEINWGSLGNQIEVVNPGDQSSHLIAVLTGESGKETIEKLLFSMILNDNRRIVSVEFTPEGAVYRTFADPNGRGVKVESVQALRAFLIQEERAMALRMLAEEFANAYFRMDRSAMSQMTKTDIPGQAQAKIMGPETEIEKMTIQYPQNGNYISTAAADVSIAFYEPGVTDSYTYLMLHMTKNIENGKWSVEAFWLEK